MLWGRSKKKPVETDKEKIELDRLEKKAEESEPIGRKKGLAVSAQSFMKLYSKALIIVADPKSKSIFVGCRGLVIMTAMRDKDTNKILDVVTPLLDVKKYTDGTYIRRLLNIIDGAMYNFAKVIYARKKLPREKETTFYKGPKGFEKIGKPIRSKQKRKLEKLRKKQGRFKK